MDDMTVLMPCLVKLPPCFNNKMPLAVAELPRWGALLCNVMKAFAGAQLQKWCKLVIMKWYVALLGGATLEGGKKWRSLLWF